MKVYLVFRISFDYYSFEDYQEIFRDEKKAIDYVDSIREGSPFFIRKKNFESTAEANCREARTEYYLILQEEV